jgi:glycosyltransferase involved in cell wall biosynthesis
MVVRPLMRVLLVNPSPIRGGAEEMLDAFVRGFDPARVQAEVACLAGGPFTDELEAAGAVVHRIDAGRMRQAHHWAATVRTLARMAKGFDAVCSWQVKGHYYGTPAARRAGVPALWWDHGIRPVRGERSWLAGGAIPRSLKADLVLTSSRAAAQRHRNACAIHPGIDVAQFDGDGRDALRKEWGLGDEPLVGIVGRLQPWKGQHVFLRAAARIVRKNPDARFVIVGDAIGGFSEGYPAQLRWLAGELGIADKVIFAGQRRDIPAVMAALDVVVHASRSEPFGIVIVEAMAAGKPVVATRGGGVGEIVVDGSTGMLVAVEDERAMSDAALRLIVDRPFAGALGRAARARAEACFGVERMVTEFSDVLTSSARRGAEVAR